MTEVEQNLARRLDRLEREVRDLSEGVTSAHYEILQETRKNHALSRVLMAVTALAARDAPDPLRFTDEVRTLALEPMTDAELDETRERIETILSKVEGSLTRPKL
ncbi:hypothetical protein [Brevundimonas diminuta]|uniref:hypothetical protein n=1 Tax=Brevundimonas diminuta TaxID=293 RepID=UPI00092CA611|nr:MAG: hypothetical protein BGO02_00555 [Brevundimonas sp. 67-6]